MDWTRWPPDIARIGHHRTSEHSSDGVGTHTAIGWCMLAIASMGTMSPRSNGDGRARAWPVMHSFHRYLLSGAPANSRDRLIELCVIRV